MASSGNWMPTKMHLYLKEKRINEPSILAELILITQVDLLGFCMALWLTWEESSQGRTVMRLASWSSVFARAKFSLYFALIFWVVNKTKMCFLFISLEERFYFFSLSLLRKAWYSYECHGTYIPAILSSNLYHQNVIMSSDLITC